MDTTYHFSKQEITETIESVSNPRFGEVKEVVGKALNFEKLNIQDLGLLLKSCESEDLFEYIIASADILKKKVFGDKVKIYIPVYITNICTNNCVYCGFRKDNPLLSRKRLSLEEFGKEIESVLNIGHRTIELVLGNDTKLDGPRLAQYIEITAKKLNGKGSIILMSEPMGLEDYKILKDAGLNEVYCWQETYNPNRYAEVHPEGTHKHDYQYRLTIFDRILQAGIRRYGMGVLFGLYNWEYDVLALLRHAQQLEEEYGIAPYAFGIPRLKKARGALTQRPFCRVTDNMYRLVVAVYRLAFPTAHIYMNTRENLRLILDLLIGGGSEVNIEASTVPGGYTKQFVNGEQFFHYSYDSRNIIEILKSHKLEAIFDEFEPIQTRRQDHRVKVF